MRIGIDIVTTQNQFAHLGVGNYTTEVVRRMVEQDKKNEFFLFKYDAPSTLDKYLMADDTTESTEMTFKPLHSNVHFVNCGKFWEGSRLNMVGLNWIWFNIQFLPKIRSYDLDVYFSPLPFRGIPLKYTKVVSVVHDVLQIPLNSYSERGPLINLLKKYEYWYDLNNISKSDRIITDTDYTRKDLEKYVQIPQNKVKVVPLGIKEDLEPVEKSSVRITESYNVTTPYIMYLGGVEHHKNIATLIKAFQKLITKYPDLDHKLVLVGGGFKKENPRGKKYLKLIKKLGLEDRVVLTGFVDPEDMKYIFSAADLYVTLSLYEGFGLPPIEAMRCKTAVLASDRSCHTEVLGEYAIYVDPDNLDEIVEKMHRVLIDDALREKVGEEGYKFVKKYSWDTTAKETLKIISDVVE